MVVTVTPARATTRHRRPSIHRIAHAGYVIDFRFVGYYPPPSAQLRALADDARLVSLTL